MISRGNHKARSMTIHGLPLLLLLTLVPCCTCRVIDLTHIYGDDVLYPPIGPDPNNPTAMFNFTTIERGWSKLTNSWLETNWFGMFEHGSTHIDAPSHFVEGRPRLHAVPADHLIGPGVMIDITKKAEADMNYQLSVADIEDWEKKNGQIPSGAIVMMNSGWHKKYPNRNLYYGSDNPDDFSTHNHPGLHVDAANWLMNNRQIRAFGTDAASCDKGKAENQFPTHVALLGNDVLVLEMVANLDMMPAKGTTVFLGAVRLRNGSGGPTRILAVYGDDTTSGAGVPRVSWVIVAFASILAMKTM